MRFGRLFGGVQHRWGGPAGAGWGGIGGGRPATKASGGGGPPSFEPAGVDGVDRGLASEALRHANNDLNLAMTFCSAKGKVSLPLEVQGIDAEPLGSTWVEMPAPTRAWGRGRWGKNYAEREI